MRLTRAQALDLMADAANAGLSIDMHCYRLNDGTLAYTFAITGTLRSHDVGVALRIAENNGLEAWFSGEIKYEEEMVRITLGDPAQGESFRVLGQD